MKKIVMVLTLMLVFSTVGFASPLMDYSQGKGAIDITLRPSNNLNFGGDAIVGGSIDGATSNFDFGLTFGLGNNFAFQWLDQTAKSKTYYESGDVYGYNFDGSGNTKLTANQFNVLYKLDNNFSGFVGYTQAKNEAPLSGTIDGESGSGTLPGKTASGYQVGFIGTFPMGDNLTGYGTVGFGNKIESFEVGIAYALAKNTELNVSYKSIKYKDLQFDITDAPKYDEKVDGLAAGITFKF